MATMNVSLPAAMKEWVEEQVRSGRYANSSDVMRDLVRREQERARQLSDLGRIAQKALDSGRVSMAGDELLEHLRQTRSEAVRQSKAS